MTEAQKRVPRCNWCQSFSWYYERMQNGRYIRVDRGRCIAAGKEVLPTRPVHDCVWYRKKK